MTDEEFLDRLFLAQEWLEDSSFADELDADSGAAALANYHEHVEAGARADERARLSGLVSGPDKFLAAEVALGSTPVTALVSVIRADERAKVLAAVVAVLDADGAYDTTVQLAAFAASVADMLKKPA